MNILILGSGGREHALANAYAKNKRVKKIFVAPGNPFIDFSNKKAKSLPENSSTDFEKILDAVKKFKIELVDVAQDDPIALGFVDKLNKDRISAFGPTKNASEIEWSKQWSRNFMQKYHLPIPHFKSFNSVSRGIFYVKSLREQALFVKASGLALGKGAIRAENKKEAITAIRSMKQFGKAGETFVIEEEMKGEEFSAFAVCDGKTYQIVGIAQDHKRVFNHDEGPNTGGMGCISNPKIVTAKIIKEIEMKILTPFMNGMEKEGRPYFGVLYLGGMITEKGVKIVEFNARWGDPEAEVLIPSIKTDYLTIVESVIQKKLRKLRIKNDGNYRVAVTAAPRGYPGDYSNVKGKKIFGIENAAKIRNVTIYGAGVKKENGNYIVSSGRLMHVVGVGKNVIEARKWAYQAMSLIHIEGNNLHFRTDIGWRDMERLHQ